MAAFVLSSASTTTNMASTSEKMDPEIAKRLLTEGATLIFLDVPPKTEFGIDYNSWNVGTEFKGVKMIPPGIHFVYYSAVSRDNQTAPRTGFFHDFKRGEIVVKKWDKYQEDIKEDVVSEEELERFRINIKELDRYLGVYPYDSWKKWISQTNYLTEPILSRLQPLNNKISSASHLVLDDTKLDSDENESPTSSKRQKVEEDFLPKMRLKPGTEIRFHKIPDKRYPEGSSAAEITKHSLDKSFMLEQFLKNYDQCEDILGDIQMGFICFIIGQVYDAFEEWKNVVTLLCSCDTAITKYPDLFSKFIFVMHHEIQEIPRDFFVDIVTEKNFLTHTLSLFFSNLENNSDTNIELQEKGKRFKKYLTKTFKWDFNNEDDDDLPVVVET